MINEVLTCFSKYADFSGRASRKEYWFYTLFWYVTIIALIFAENALGISGKGNNWGPVVNTFNFATLLPSLSVAARRMHDCGKSGWFQFIPFVNCFYFLGKGDWDKNRFGKPPESHLLQNA